MFGICSYTLVCIVGKVFKVVGSVLQHIVPLTKKGDGNLCILMCVTQKCKSYLITSIIQNQSSVQLSIMVNKYKANNNHSQDHLQARKSSFTMLHNMQATCQLHITQSIHQKSHHAQPAYVTHTNLMHQIPIARTGTSSSGVHMTTNSPRTVHKDTSDIHRCAYGTIYWILLRIFSKALSPMTLLIIFSQNVTMDIKE